MKRIRIPHTAPLKIAGLVIVILAVAMQSGCSTKKNRYSQKQDRAPQKQINVASIPDAIPIKTTRSKYGNPESYKVFGKRYRTLKTSKGYQEKGIASWYGTKFHGHRTSSGETYDMYAMTAAHKTLPLPTFARVTNLENGRSVIVKINDRGPFHKGRIVDLSYAAAIKLGINKTGIGRVEVLALEAGDYAAAAVTNKLPTQQIATADFTEIASFHTEAIPNSQIYLQLGAFSDRSNAEKLQSRLTTSNFQGVQIIPAGNINQEIYRVRIGPLQDEQTADTLATMLKQHGVKKSRIILD